MPDYMFLLESRLSPEQRAALERVQELSRLLDLNIYLTGGAVRDLISGQPIRDLDFTVEGNPVRMVRELEKGGAKIVSESEKLRHYEIVFAGDADGSISGARDDVYEKPGAKPEYRFAGIMEDLRRRDFSINAIAISLNVQSRGLLLDPTNGLADLERQEVRALSIHAFTNQPIRLMRILRYSARMGFNMEQRTHEWFDLAVERGLNANLEGADVGYELRAVARDDNPVAALKLWESHGLLEAIHPKLQRRKPDYDSLNKLARIRGNYLAVGLRPRLHVAVTGYILGRLKAREMAAALRNLEFRSAEIDAISELVPEAQKVVKILKGRKTNTPRDAYAYLASLPPEMLAFIEVELPNPRALSKIRNYIQKWRPLRLALPIGELDALGIPRGPQFDKILDQLFDLQLRGKAKTPEDRTRILRDLAGIKDEVKKKPEKEKKKGKGEAPAASAKASPLKHGAREAAAASDAGQHAPAAPGPGARAKHEKPAAARRVENSKSKSHHPKKSRSR
jgi:tRNA nucleotidyltransferase (CCA-adding enzyme)